MTLWRPGTLGRVVLLVLTGLVCYIQLTASGVRFIDFADSPEPVGPVQLGPALCAGAPSCPLDAAL